MALRILIFSIAVGADYSFYVKTIETHARAFFKVIIFSIGSVTYNSIEWDEIFLMYHFFLHYGWFYQNLGKEAVRSNMHTTVSR